MSVIKDGSTKINLQPDALDMAKIEKLDDRRKGDSLTARLALAAAEKPEPVGDCLSNEQLADVAAGCCTPEERKAALAHFSSCRKCYEAWVAVSFSLAAMESGLERRRRPLLSLRNLGYLGSAFAVAASVVLFLQIRETPRQFMAPPAVEKSTESVRQMALPQDKDAVLRKETAAGEPPASPAAATEKNKAEQPAPGQPVTETTTASESQGEKKSIAPAAPSAKRQAPAAMMTDMTQDSAKGEAQLPATEWLARVERSCREKSYRQDTEGWNRLVGQGKAAAESGADPRIRGRVTSVQAILAEENAAGGAEEQCRRILQLLAEGGGSE